MNSSDIRQKFLAYFFSKGHKRIPSSSLVPEADPTVLFTTAGMQQFKLYYSHPDDATKDFGSKNVVSIQKCVRTGDIEEVGDSTHLTFFEMLGNFSFGYRPSESASPKGGYGRREAIVYAHDFITKELGLEISYVTYFRGNDFVPKDTESHDIWLELGIKDIREDGEDVFWGPTGDSGPCGPTTEIYCKNAAGEDVEVWNIVFNEYMCDGSREKLDKGEAKLTKSETLGIDTGMGFERLLATVQNKRSVYDTDLFEKVFEKIESMTSVDDLSSKRIIADHARTAMFLISDGVLPSNNERGYILRRLIRRAVRISEKIGMREGALLEIVEEFVHLYGDIYENIDLVKIKEVIQKEETKFRETLSAGLKEFEKGTDPFTLFTTYGFPIEMTLELAKEKGVSVDMTDFENKMKEHKDLSQSSSAGMFKGGLVNHEPQTIKLHTAHHLLLKALQEVLGHEVKQKGSNITEDRLRMDFAFDRKMTDEEKKEVERLVNEAIQKKYKVIKREMPKEEAEKLGAEMEFGAKYPDIVSVYFIEDENGNPYSIEFCGGPHVENTGELGANSDGTPKVFKIKKEEASSAGVRRIKAILE
ncbi:MAG: alanine--tRNA ligase [Candidatus Nomurabacteria bacterium]|nr:MAG: alanine--tRNA ligase [Candidatus Nomurabacteria bacterium]